MAWNMFLLNAPSTTLEWVMIVATATMITGYLLFTVVRIFSDKVAERVLISTMVPAMVVCGCIAVALFTK